MNTFGATYSAGIIREVMQHATNRLHKYYYVPLIIFQNPIREYGFGRPGLSHEECEENIKSNWREWGRSGMKEEEREGSVKERGKRVGKNICYDSSASIRWHLCMYDTRGGGRERGLFVSFALDFNTKNYSSSETRCSESIHPVRI